MPTKAHSLSLKISTTIYNEASDFDSEIMQCKEGTGSGEA